MPYFWENASWRQKLKLLGIQPPDESKFILSDYCGLPDELEKVFLRHAMCLMASQIDGYKKEVADAITASICPDIKTNYIRPLFEMLNLSKGDSIVEHLLTTEGVGRVLNTEDNYNIQKSIDEFLLNIASNIKEKDPRLEFLPVGIGSMAENCKVGYPDEYDYRLDINLQPEDLSRYIVNNFELKRLFSEINNGSLTYLRDFYISFVDILKATPIGEPTPALVYLAHGYNDSGVLFLLFKWNNKMLVKVDCVPSIVAQGFWPSERERDPLGVKIPKLSHVILKRDFTNDVVNLSWSVCVAEVDFATRLADHIKDGYALAKIVCGPAVSHSTCSLINLTFGLPNSYSLKNSLYHIIEKGEYNSLIQENYMENVLSIAKAILQDCAKWSEKSFFFNNNLSAPEPPFLFAYDIVNELEVQHKSKYFLPMTNKSFKDPLVSEIDQVLAFSSGMVQSGNERTYAETEKTGSKIDKIKQMDASMLNKYKGLLNYMRNFHEVNSDIQPIQDACKETFNFMIDLAIDGIKSRCSDIELD